MLRTGLRVRARGGASGAASVELWLDAATAKRYRLGRKVTRIGRAAIRLRAGSNVAVTVKPTRKAASRLRGARRLKLSVALLQNSNLAASGSTMLRR